MDVFERHILDLSQRAFDRNYCTFSEFLNADEISALLSMKLPTKFRLYGGYGDAERCVACFFTDESVDFPIKRIVISPLNSKFSDKLTHRDYLGALMNLGINRNTLGDIVLNGDTAYLFCLSSISEYVIDNLMRIKHTSVKCEVAESEESIIVNPPESEEITVPSLRADAVCATVYKLSRKGVSELFSSGKIFINSRLCEKESVQLKSGDKVTVRGKGRFIFSGEIRQTKRGRLVIAVSVYK